MADGRCYEGAWTHGKPNGFGRRSFTDGTYYEGQFKEGKYHGEGTFFNPHNTLVSEEGVWENSKLIRKIKLKDYRKEQAKIKERQKEKALKEEREKAEKERVLANLLEPEDRK